jgi:hypothetical protein
VGISTTSWNVVQRLYCSNRKGWRDCLDGLGLFLGQAPWNLLSCYCQISQHWSLSRASYVSCSSSPLKWPWLSWAFHLPAEKCSTIQSSSGNGFFLKLHHTDGRLATLFHRPSPNRAYLGRLNICSGSNPVNLVRVTVGTEPQRCQPVFSHENVDHCNWAGFTHNNPALQPVKLAPIT